MPMLEEDREELERLFETDMEIPEIQLKFPSGDFYEDGEPISRYTYNQISKWRVQYRKNHGLPHDRRGRKPSYTPSTTPDAPKRQHGAPTLERALLAAAMQPGPLQVIPDTVTKVEITLKWDQDQLDHIEAIIVNLFNK